MQTFKGGSDDNNLYMDKLRLRKGTLLVYVMLEFF